MKDSFSALAFVRIVILAIVMVLLAILPAHAASTSTDEGFSRSGIFDCNEIGAESMGSVGTKTAIEATYVPVFDAAVTRNTGTLIYKECILDAINARMAENAAFSHAQLGIKAFIEGADGEPMFIKDYVAKVLERSKETFLRTLKNGELDTLNPAFQDEVKQAIVQDYKTQTRAANQVLACSYEGDLEKVHKGTSDDIWGGIMTFTEPACTPVGALWLAQEYVEGKITLDKEEMLFRLNNSNAIKDVQEFNEETGHYETLTPGIIVAGNVQQLITSGYRRLENADEIGEMVDALYSGLSSQVISDTRGLTGITESVAGQPSYLDQIAKGLSKGLRDSVVNIALRILSAAKQTEQVYFNAMNAIAVNLVGTIGQLRDAEKQCWDLVVPKAQEYASAHSFQITVATSTMFSQNVINVQISTLASTTITNIERSENALSLIDRLIAGITNTTSLDAQRVALQQLDSLVAQGALHGEYDAQQATKRKDDIEATMKGLVEDTVEEWADSTDVNVGWCNINNPDVPKMWAEEWRD